MRATTLTPASRSSLAPRAGGAMGLGRGSVLATVISLPPKGRHRALGPVARRFSVYRVPLPARLATVDALVLSTMPGPLFTVSKPPTVFALVLKSLRNTIGR